MNDVGNRDPDALPVRGRRRRGGFFAGSMANGFELGRLERALKLQAHPVGTRQFEVVGGMEPHYVDLSRDTDCPCDCGDTAWRGGPHPGPCMHIIRSMLAEGDPRAVLAVATLVEAMREYATTLERSLRPRPIRITRAVKAHVADVVGHAAEILRFARSETGISSTVHVTLEPSGVRLGSLVRDRTGVAFVPEPPFQPLAAAA